MPKFGETPDHGVDKCASCNHLVEIKGIRFREHIKQCARISDEIRIPAVVTECNIYARKNTQSLHEMHMIAWVLELDQKKREIGFKPPRTKDEDSEDRMWREARKLNDE